MVLVKLESLPYARINAKKIRLSKRIADKWRSIDDGFIRKLRIRVAVDSGECAERIAGPISNNAGEHESQWHFIGAAQHAALSNICSRPRVVLVQIECI